MLDVPNHPVVRRLDRPDEGELCRILLGLEVPARCSRFGQAASDAYLAGHARTAFANADCILGSFIGERLRGFAEVYNNGAHGFAEAAFVVEQKWRRRGLGWALLQAAMQAAADSGANTLRMIFSRHNWPMRKLACKATGKLDIIFDEISADVDLGEIQPFVIGGRGIVRDWRRLMPHCSNSNLEGEDHGRCTEPFRSDGSRVGEIV
jgi:GNAT superfamily N-acetyltransferase